MSLNKELHFIGKYMESGHDEIAANAKPNRGYPVFSTYNKNNPDEKHTNAWIVFEEDAIEWANMKNFLK